MACQGDGKVFLKRMIILYRNDNQKKCQNCLSQKFLRHLRQDYGKKQNKNEVVTRIVVFINIPLVSPQKQGSQKRGSGKNQNHFKFLIAPKFLPFTYKVTNDN